MDADDMMAFHMQLLADPVIRSRIAGDPEMRAAMTRMISEMPADHRAMMQKMLTPVAAAKKPAARTGTRPAAKKPAVKAAAKPAAKKPVVAKPAPKKDSMAGMDHSKMRM